MSSSVLLPLFYLNSFENHNVSLHVHVHILLNPLIIHSSSFSQAMQCYSERLLQVRKHVLWTGIQRRILLLRGPQVQLQATPELRHSLRPVSATDHPARVQVIALPPHCMTTKVPPWPAEFFLQSSFFTPQPEPGTFAPDCVRNSGLRPPPSLVFHPCRFRHHIAFIPLG